MKRLFCALDTTDLSKAQALACALAGRIGGLKLGLEFFVANGPAGVRAVMDTAAVPLFLDLKFHDIPNTVAGAVRAAVALRPAYLTLHSSGGLAMMQAARTEAAERAAALGVPRPKLLGVTVLTSLSESDLRRVGMTAPMESQVLRLAEMAKMAGLDGIVCSPQEVRAVRIACGADFTLMVPGIRPVGAEAGDQKRAATPAQALADGADYLVIGRPITQAEDPAAAVAAIAATL